MFPTSRRRQVLTVSLLALLATAAWQLTAAGWIHAKALLAQQLLAHAWRTGVDAGAPTKPWPWADTWPAARLQLPAQGVDQYVLAGTSGQALAFGPGLHQAFDGSNGWTVVAGHRDTHFAFLRGVAVGNVITLQPLRGTTRHYRVTATRIVDSRRDQLDLLPVAVPRLLLVTCYPFDAVAANGPLRYVVEARAVVPARRFHSTIQPQGEVLL